MDAHTFRTLIPLLIVGVLAAVGANMTDRYRGIFQFVVGIIVLCSLVLILPLAMPK